MVLEKRAGDPYSVTVRVSHEGPARNITIITVIAPGHDLANAWGHGDRIAKINSGLPAALDGPVETQFTVRGVYPGGLAVNVEYDVLTAIGPVKSSSQSYSAWFDSRGDGWDDDWDDNVFKYPKEEEPPPVPKSSAKLVSQSYS